MAFLDNSGDIILDAVLTDTGRMRLAKGDGSFKITKFALGDDEINYRLYNKNHPSGSAYFDLEILQTPILEAFTDNAASLKSKLLTIPRNNLLFLPVIKLNNVFDPKVRMHTSGAFIVAADSDTEAVIMNVNGVPVDGIIPGETGNGGTHIRIDQGLDTPEVSLAVPLDSDLLETQYIVEIDNRLGSIASTNNTKAVASYIDDDMIASYFFSLGTDTQFVNNINDVDINNIDKYAIRSSRGTFLQFSIRSSLDLNTSTYLFDQLGDYAGLLTKDNPTTGESLRYIDTTVRVTGATTGYRIDIPVRFVKL
jgi:hypothetical protein